MSEVTRLVKRTHCFLCGSPLAAWFLSKKDKPFWKCGWCFTTIFLNTEPGHVAVRAWESEILSSPERMNAIMARAIAAASGTLKTSHVWPEEVAAKTIGAKDGKPDVVQSPKA
jgi:hypothetical protein